MYKIISVCLPIILLTSACSSDIRDPDRPPTSIGGGGISGGPDPKPTINPAPNPAPLATPSLPGTTQSPAPTTFSTPVPRPTTEIPAPNLVYAINAGGRVFISQDGTLFSKDEHMVGGKAATARQSIRGSQDDELFQSERYGVFSYDLPIDNGTYSIYIYFSENYFGKRNKRLVDISVESKRVVEGIDVFALAGGKYSPYELLIDNVMVRDGALSLDFQPSLSNDATIAGIKVLMTNPSGRLDADHDGVEDSRDRCPFTFGFGSADGCIKPVSTHLTRPALHDGL